MKKVITKYYEDADGNISEEVCTFVKAGTNSVSKDDPRLVAAEPGDAEEWFLLMSVGEVRDYSKMKDLSKLHVDNIPLNNGVSEINENAYKAKKQAKKQAAEQAEQARLNGLAQQHAAKQAAKDRVKAKLVELGVSLEDLELGL